MPIAPVTIWKSKSTNTPSMVATVKFDKPKEMEVPELEFDRKALGMAFKKDARAVSGALDALAEDWKDFEPIAKALEADGKATVDGFEITKDMLTWTKTGKKVHEAKFAPSVVEPSFPLGWVASCTRSWNTPSTNANRTNNAT